MGGREGGREGRREEGRRCESEGERVEGKERNGATFVINIIRQAPDIILSLSDIHRETSAVQG